MRPALWLLTPLLLLALLYALLPRLASYSIERWLQARGIEQPRIELDYPGWNRLQIRSFRLSQQQNGQRIILESGPVLIEYDPLDLIGQLHLNSVRISSLTLQLQTQPGSAPESPALDLSPLLPAAWLALAPADRLQVGQLDLSLQTEGQPSRGLRGNIDLYQGRLHSRMQLFENDSALGWLDLTLDEDNRFELSLLQDSEPIYRASGELRQDAGQLEVQLQQSLELAGTLRWLQQLPSPLLLGEQLSAQLLSDEMPVIEGRIEAQGLLRLPLTLASAQWLQQMTLEQQLGGALQLGLNRPELQRVQLPLDASLSLAAGTLSFSLAAGSRADLSGLTLPGFAPVRASAQLQTPLQLTWPLGEPDPEPLQLPAFGLLLQSPALQHARGTLKLSPIRLDISQLDLQQYSATGRLRITEINWQMPGQRLPLAALDSRFELKNSMLSNRFTLDLADPALKLQGRASTRLSPFVSDIHWQASPLALQQAEQLWNRYYPPAPPELSVSAGVLHHNGSANINSRGLALRLEQHTDQLAAHWGALEVQGLNWQSSTELRHNGLLLHRGQMQVERLDTGFPLQTIALDYNYQQTPAQTPALQLNSLTANLLGGTLALDSVAINPLSPTLSTELKLQHLQLAKVLELQQQKGLSGEGVLSGRLPLTFDASGFQVRDGQISSEGPGKIRFVPDAKVAALGQAHQGMAMALKALKNFQYEALSVKLQYDANGAALMNTRLQGRNPDWNNGRPVDFSINIEQNLLTLMQTLQFTDKLTESIEKRYR
uniref:intermembrane phospholipid transport protein YdbH family protein n=1 Tax=Marinobacterium profundum TaxID=1714300 RepID=UPI00082FB01F|nr:YdbH domain-containing protein [Marinobacterium profundum]